MLGGVMHRIDELNRRESAITGVSTGFEKLDELTAGLQQGYLVIAADRPLMAYTARTCIYGHLEARNANGPPPSFAPRDR